MAKSWCCREGGGGTPGGGGGRAREGQCVGPALGGGRGVQLSGPVVLPAPYLAELTLGGIIILLYDTATMISTSHQGHIAKAGNASSLTSSSFCIANGLTLKPTQRNQTHKDVVSEKDLKS